MARSDWDAGLISRKNAQALMPPVVMREIEKGVRKNSVFFSHARRLPNMQSAEASRPVLAMLPKADFVEGDIGLKAVSEMAWDKKFIYVGEIATIIPIPINVLDDADYPIWEEVYPAVSEAIGRTADLATIAVRNPKAPAQWPDPLIPGTIAQGNVVTTGAAGTDILTDLSNTFALLEEDEYDVNGVLARRSLRTQLRDARAANGMPLFQDFYTDAQHSPYGVPVSYAGKGIWNAAADQDVLAIAGDWNNVVYSVRRDMSFQIFQDGVISDDTGKVIYNLMQQDMVALRVFFRFGWAVANPIDIDRDPDNYDAAANYYTFAVLKKGASGGGTP